MLMEVMSFFVERIRLIVFVYCDMIHMYKKLYSGGVEVHGKWEQRDN